MHDACCCHETTLSVARGSRPQVADTGMNRIMGGNSEPALLIAVVVEIHISQMADLRQETSNEGHDEY